ncbi:MAG: hypothetical protein KTR14_10015 [Vampirovibrio sp.]|nr:hypothetical protein [Vampirovibrio sp.]
MNNGFIVSLHYRIGRYLYLNRQWPVHGILLILYKIYYRWLQFFFSCEISYLNDIGSGFRFVHCVGSILHPQIKIGKNFHLAQNVTLGDAGGIPTIGNNVVIAPGVKIFGPIQIGNGVVIGANAVVNKDVPDNARVGGVPARVLSSKGSQEFMTYVDYE